MLSKHIPGFKLMHSGVMSRLEENENLFLGILVKYYSGKNVFELKISGGNGIYLQSFLGRESEITKEEILDVIINKLPEYDKAEFYYSERIGTVKVAVDECGKVSTTRNSSSEKLDTATVGGRKYIITEQNAPELLSALGILSGNGKIKNDMIRKYNQIDRFLELIADLKFPEGTINIMDCACGKSYLSFVLDFYYTEILKRKCMVYGVDYNKKVIEASEKTRNILKYNNMSFISADLKDFRLNKKVHLAVSLHACDTATDYALFSGILNNAEAIVSIPCCHKELAEIIDYPQFESIFRHGIFKRRFCDILTDALRVLLLEAMGYKTSVIEYVSPLDTPKNIMIKAVKTGGFNSGKLREFNELSKQFNAEPELYILLKENGMI